MNHYDYCNPGLPIEERVQDLLKRMTIEEKAAQLDMVRGVELAEKIHPAHFCAIEENSDFDWDKVKDRLGSAGIGFVHDVYSVPAVLNKLQRYFVEETRLGIPCIFTGEALHGLSYPGAMVYPVPLALGATFDPDLVKEVGHQIAEETRSLGIHEILAPNLDVARDPRWGRTEETFGEDTYLSSCMAEAIISGEQGDSLCSADSVLTEPKHYCVHGIPEGGTNCSAARVGIREIERDYLPVFEAGIQKGGAYNVMASYNSIDGEAVIASDYYLRKILRNRFGMRGYVRADFGAVNRLKTHHHMTREDKDSICMALKNGLQVQGFDYSNAYWQSTIVELVQEGRISPAILDEAVVRVLTAKFELGLFERPYTDESSYRGIIRNQRHQDTSYQAAAESAVLLRNEDEVLPISKQVKSIALIGPGADTPRLGGYSSVPYGYQLHSVYEELQEAVGDQAEIYMCEGCGITDKAVMPMPEAWFMNGVSLEYYNNETASGEPAGTGSAKKIDFNWILAKPHHALTYVNYSVRMRADIKVDTSFYTEDHSFTGTLVFTTSDSVKIWLDGELIIHSVKQNKQDVPSYEMQFEDGEVHHLEIEYLCDVNGSNVMLGIRYEKDELEEAAALAKDCDLVIAICGDDHFTSGEGMDRCDLKLYGRQQELLKKAKTWGKPLVLVLVNGKPVDLQEEQELADAILCAWFGGELGARAIVNLLLGKEVPSGRLPISFPRSVGHLPCYYSRLPGGSSAYLEGACDPLYPFGHGLSYTSFDYQKIQVKKMDICEYQVKVTIKNTGRYAGDEVVQFYLNDVESSIVTPDQLLKAFQRIHLEPGEEKTVIVTLDFDSFKLLDRELNWVAEPGEFVIMAGASSADIRLTEVITVDELISKEQIVRKGTGV